MRNIRSNSGFTVFVLFFGIALIDGLQSGSWLKAAFWFAIGSFFLLADSAHEHGRT